MPHHALSVPDIVRLVFDEIGDEDKTALARSARCCRAFHDTALDMLWKHLESVAPLRGLLPDSELRDDEIPAPITEERWKRFDSYAQRVRTWVFDSRGMDAILYCHLATIRPGVVPFPFLRELQLFERIGTPPIFRLPRSLRCLYINFSYWQSNGPRYGEQYLIAAIDQVPTLEELKFYGPVPLTSLARCAEFKCLRVLKLLSADLPLGAITVLSSLPTLAMLELPRAPLQSAGISPHMGFNQLEALALSGHPLTITKLLEAITSPKLRFIAIRNSPLDMSPGSFAEWNACFECIRDRFGPSLRTFEIKAVATIGRMMSPMELLKPLMDLHQMEEFTLSDLVQSISIEDVLAMGSAWPHLRLFTLPPIRGASHPPDFVLQCLASIARRCPKLVTLTIAIAIDHSFLPPVSQFIALSHGLQRLRLVIKTPSQVEDYIHLARLLDRLFPALEEIEVNQVSVNILAPFGSARSGFDVPDFMKIIQAARKQRCLP